MSLPTLRTQIDRVDSQLLRFLNRRAALALRVGRVKVSRGLPVFDGRREALVLRRLAGANRGPLTKRAVRRIFREILRQNRWLESSSGSA